LSSQLESSFLKGSITALESGKKTQRPIIFVHGYLDNAASFNLLISYLPDFHCIAIDLPGHGKSKHRSPDAHYHLTDYVYDLHALIQEQKWTQVSLVGHSLGGIICSIYASLFPEHVQTLVCIESMGPLCEPEFTAASQLRESMASREKAKMPIKQPESMEQVVAARMRVSDLSAQEAIIILDRNIENKQGQLTWRTDKRLRTKSALRFTPNQAMDIIENIQCRFNLVLGKQGFIKLRRLLKQRAGLFKDLHLTELAGGHHVHMQSSKDVADIIQKAIKGQES
jgi:pimeloyl-ACP methyl ester carboxylesterase